MLKTNVFGYLVVLLMDSGPSLDTKYFYILDHKYATALYWFKLNYSFCYWLIWCQVTFMVPAFITNDWACLSPLLMI